MAFSPARRIRSFLHAFRGVGTVLHSEPNARIHWAATVVVIVLGAVFSISELEWTAVVLALGLVWISEALNTAVEFLADEVSREQRALIGKAKDAAAAGVLWAAISALVVGFLVFYPHVARLLKP
jgi:diacylglycerol kinase